MYTHLHNSKGLKEQLKLLNKELNYLVCFISICERPPRKLSAYSYIKGHLAKVHAVIGKQNARRKNAILKPLRQALGNYLQLGA